MRAIEDNPVVRERNLSVGKLLEDKARRNPSATVLESPGRVALTYERLRNQVTYVVDTLNRIGIGRNDRVALVAPNGAEMATAFIAVSSGAICAPLNPAFKESEFDFYLSDLKAKALIVHAELDSPAVSVARKRNMGIFVLSPSWTKEAGVFELTTVQPPQAGGHLPGLAEPDDSALILHTSGTTSRPKIVSLSHANICASAHNIQSTFNLTQDDRCLSAMPLYHVHGLIGGLLSSLVSGGSVICWRSFDAATFFQLTRDFRPTWYTAVPTIHQAILQQAVANNDVVQRSSFRFIRSCSAPLPFKVMRDLEEVFRTPVVESYGMTEASHQIASNPLPPFQRKPGSVGKAAGPNVAIMDELGILLPNGQSGEIVLRGATVIQSYTENPSANASAFTNGWFRTGDRGFLDPDGYLYINGRIKELINRGGEKVAPREIDEVLLDHPAVLQAMAFAVPHPTLGEDAYAAVVLRPGFSINQDELVEFASTRLNDNKAPRRVFVVAALPLGPTGKPQRINAAEKLGIEIGKFEFLPAVDTRERELTRLWCDVLKVDRVGTTDNFFELGGDSLKATEVAFRLQQKFNVTLSSDVLLRAATIQKLKEVLANAKKCERPSSLLPIQPLGSRRPLFLINALGWDPFGWRKLPDYLGPHQPVYILKSRGLDGDVSPHDRVETMAADYLDELRVIEPSGPYLLAGYSSGGVVAFEMAQQLSAQGQEVGLLTLIDTRFSRDHRFLETGHKRSRTYKMVQNIDDYLGRLLSLCCNERLSEVPELLRSKIGTALSRSASTSDGRKANDTGGEVHRRVLEVNQQAVLNYIPQSYSGRLTMFLCSGDSSRSARDSRLAWSRVAPNGIELHVVPGNHVTLFHDAPLKVLADKLTTVIRRSER